MILQDYPTLRVERLRRDGSELTVRFLNGSVILFDYVGRAIPEEVRFFEPMIDELFLADVRPRMFVDTTALHEFHPQFRAEISRWNLKAAQYAPPITILVPSRLVAMVVSVSRLVLGNAVEPCSNRDAYERRVRSALRGDTIEVKAARA